MTARSTPELEAQVAGLRASGMTHKAIAQRLNMPRTTVSRILARAPVQEVVTTSTRKAVSERLWTVVDAATQEALRRIHDPKTRAGELAQLLKIAAEQHALLTGDVTARTATIDETPQQPVLNYEQTENLRRYFESIVDTSDEELAENAVELQRGIRAYAKVQQLMEAGTDGDVAIDTALREYRGEDAPVNMQRWYDEDGWPVWRESIDRDIDTPPETAQEPAGDSPQLPSATAEARSPSEPVTAPRSAPLWHQQEPKPVNPIQAIRDWARDMLASLPKEPHDE